MKSFKQKAEEKARRLQRERVRAAKEAQLLAEQKEKERLRRLDQKKIEDDIRLVNEDKQRREIQRLKEIDNEIEKRAYELESQNHLDITSNLETTQKILEDREQQKLLIKDILFGETKLREDIKTTSRESEIDAYEDAQIQNIEEEIDRWEQNKIDQLSDKAISALSILGA